jgi:exopolyphosphatase/guanosine-5'-triphosphate,3'-diphosphate pyrophosphatase
MIGENYAAVDLGSNAARFIVKSVVPHADGSLQSVTLLYLRVPIRLGDDVFIKGKISEEKETELLQMFKAVCHLLKLCNVSCFRACATSSMREAKNGKEVVKHIHAKTGLTLDIISGKEEAELLSSHRSAPVGDDYYMYVDVGGGSTELSLLHGGDVIESRSFPIGTVRMLLNAVRDGVGEELELELTDLRKKYPAIHLVGSGGNIEKYYRLADSKDKINKQLPISSLKSTYEELKNLSIEERIARYSLKRDRADVIIPAGTIFLTVAKCVGAQSIMVPMYGLVDGIIAQLVRNNWKTGNPILNLGD